MATGCPIELSVEFLDARRRGEELFPQMRSLLESRYSAERIAVVVAADDPALKFLLDHAPDLLASVPVVFCGVSDDALAARAPRRRFTGVREVMTITPFLDLATSLHAPRRFFVVSDGTLNSTLYRRTVEAYGREQRSLQMIFLDGQQKSFEEILATLRKRHVTPRRRGDHALHARLHRSVVLGPRVAGAHRPGVGGADLQSRWPPRWARAWWRAASTPASSMAWRPRDWR